MSDRTFCRDTIGRWERGIFSRDTRIAIEYWGLKEERSRIRRFAKNKNPDGSLKTPFRRPFKRLDKYQQAMIWLVYRLKRGLITGYEMHSYAEVEAWLLRNLSQITRESYRVYASKSTSKQRKAA